MEIYLSERVIVWKDYKLPDSGPGIIGSSIMLGYFCAFAPSGIDIPPMMCQSFLSLSKVCVMRRVCAAPLPSLSNHLYVIQ